MNTDVNLVKPAPLVFVFFSFSMLQNICFYFHLFWTACTTEGNDADMTGFVTTTYDLLLDYLEIL